MTLDISSNVIFTALLAKQSEQPNRFRTYSVYASNILSLQMCYMHETNFFF